MSFPGLARAYGWRAVGVRHGSVDGRDATVVYYENGSRRLAYVIVAGAALVGADGLWSQVRQAVCPAAAPKFAGATATRAVRDALRAAGLETPVVLSGGISTFEQAQDLLRSGAADIIASARQSLADPDWFRKLRLGLGKEVRRCVFTNYCEGLDQVHKPVTCKLWDRADLAAPGVTTTADGKRRLTAPPWRR